jgi:hypothetical protein
MILDFFLIASSILLGSTLSKIATKMLVYQKGVNLFSILNPVLAQAKGYDILEFIVFIVASTVIFIPLIYLYKRRKYSLQQQILIGLGNIIFAFLVYLSIMFAYYSGVQTVIFSLVWYFLISTASLFIPKNLPSWVEGKKAFFNGIIAGFYFLVLFNNLTTSVALPLAIFATTPIYFYIFSKRFSFLNNPGFILLGLAFIFPFNKLILFGIAMAAVEIILVTKKIISPKFSSLIEKIYPIIILFIFLYNPIFYLGTFDSIEEGFWSGWLQRLLTGQFMYRDFAMYHPPVLIWGLSLFTKIFGVSLFNQRLYFHLLQISGLIILYTTLKNIVKSKMIQIGIFILVVAYGSTLVRNNIEIRVGIAIVPLLFVYWYNLNKRNVFLFMAGAVAALACFTSLETGIASVLATGVAVCISSSRKTFLRNLMYVFLGEMATSLPILGYLALNGAINRFFEYIFYYSGTFSSGFQNLPVERPKPQTLLEWHLVIDYVSTPGFLWELTKLSLMGGLFLTIAQKIRKNFAPVEIFVVGIAVFGLILSRSALGRSDQYHIAFVWIPALLLIGYMLQFLSHYTKIVPALVICLLIFFIGRDLTQVSLVQNQLIKFETYGNPSGSYPSYATKRAGIITGIETNPKNMDDLVTFVDSRVGKNETIFVFPQKPEIYFLTDRNNATKFDTPTTFYTKEYQNQMINELNINPPKLIVYEKKFEIQNLTSDTLHEVNEYILKNYKTITSFGEESIMQHI